MQFESVHHYILVVLNLGKELHLKLYIRAEIFHLKLN